MNSDPPSNPTRRNTLAGLGAALAIGPVWASMRTLLGGSAATLPGADRFGSAIAVVFGLAALASLVVVFWPAIAEAAYEPVDTGTLGLAAASVGLMIVAAHLIALALITSWLTSWPWLAWISAAVTYALVAAVGAFYVQQLSSRRRVMPTTAPAVDPFAAPDEVFFDPAGQQRSIDF